MWVCVSVIVTFKPSDEILSFLSASRQHEHMSMATSHKSSGNPMKEWNKKRKRERQIERVPERKRETWLGKLAEEERKRARTGWKVRMEKMLMCVWQWNPLSLMHCSHLHSIAVCVDTNVQTIWHRLYPAGSLPLIWCNTRLSPCVNKQVIVRGSHSECADVLMFSCWCWTQTQNTAAVFFSPAKSKVHEGAVAFILSPYKSVVDHADEPKHMQY